MNNPVYFESTIDLQFVQFEQHYVKPFFVKCWLMRHLVKHDTDKRKILED